MTQEQTGTERQNAAGTGAGRHGIVTDSVIYFARVGDAPFVKIGRTCKLEHRLITLQTGHWEPVWLALVMPGDAPLERELHARFADEHHAREWFAVSERIERFIRTCEPEYEDLRGRYAWYPRMTDEQLDHILAKLNPPLLTDRRRWSVNR
jgi:hypothetical protein